MTQAALSPSGQRLYSADDVRRLALLKQLTDLGHAIGSLAALDMAQLQAVAATHAQTLVSTQPGARSGDVAERPAPAWRLVVVGPALGPRLQRPALLRQFGRPVELLGPYADITQAAEALQGRTADALLLQAPQLLPGWLASLDAVAPALAGLPKLVLYGFAAEPLVDDLAAAGVALLREPQPDAVLAQWLRGQARQAGALATDALAGLPAMPPPRRWDAAALADFASLSTTVACECPRHVAELLAQLTHFEDYSAQCTHQNAADADLHRFLGRVAGEARARFEAALEHVALHEGLLLPPSSA